MFDYSSTHWITFLSAAILLNMAPGPDLAFILGQTLRHGRKTGFIAMLGIWTGAFAHVLLAATGLSVILLSSALAFNAVKWLGAIYLIWIGLQAFTASPDKFVTAETPSTRRHQSVFLQGILVAALNPKVALFFVAFLPQFVVTGAGSVAAQLFLHGSLIIVVAAFIEPLYLLIGDRMLRKLDGNPKLARWLDRSLGAFFIAIGIRLAFTEQ